MDEEPDIFVDASLQAGDWADHVRVAERRPSFVIDFASRDPFDPQQATLVARIVLPEHAANELQRKLEEAWRRYTRLEAPEGSDDQLD